MRLISREDAIKCLEMFLDKQCDRERTKERGFSDNDIWASVNMAYDALTAEKVGKWKYETMRHIITGEMRTVRICSECGGGWFRYDLSDGVEDAEPNYCPNCGTRMEGEEDG